MNKKITILVIIICTLVVGLGVSLAYFAANNSNNGNETNLNITTEELGSILWEGTKVFTSYDLLPGQIGIQEFTIEKNSDNGIGIYEIDLAGVLPEEFGTDIEISLYKTTEPETNNVTVNVADPTLENETIYQEDNLNITGTPELVYQGTLTNNSQIILEQADFDVTTLEKNSYYLVYHYKNNGNQDNQQGLTFSGTISVRIINEKMSFSEALALCDDTASNCMIKNAEKSNELVYDETADNNLRYIGADPNNYVSFNNELWRIIGVMNNIDDGIERKETRLKIIRNESIGDYSWDSSDSTINEGFGINEWSQSDIMKLLNPGYETELIGNSLYYYRGSGMCYSGVNNESAACDFSSIGLLDDSKALIKNALWNTGANNGSLYSYNNINTSTFYELERSNNSGKYCFSTTLCNDTVTRQTSWIGLVGLMYSSDYGYATGGSSNKSRSECISEYLYSWNNDCTDNNWLYKNTFQWTLTPFATPSHTCRVYCVNCRNNSDTDDAYMSHSITPVVYLSSDVRISGGTGSSGDPFTLTVS